MPEHGVLSVPDPTVSSHHGVAPAAADGPLNMKLDGREITAQPGQFLIEVAERAGVYIPRFCYHPRMKPVGMCRMCLVEVSGPRGATLQPACYIPVADGMEVVTNSEKVKKAQDGVLEFLLVNHPLDCPVCDKGGECPLQDQTFAYGPGETRFVEEKRHWAKPVPLSELVLLDRERCIQCGRCIRFALEIAGEAQIDFLGRGDQVEVNIFENEVFSSYFSGNTVQICPVGALTSTPYRFGARPWDLEQAESTCTVCAFGCRAVVQSSNNRLTRLLGIDSDAVNQSWLCDKGRFAYEAVNSDAHLTDPLLRSERETELRTVTWNEAMRFVSRRLKEICAQHGPESVGVIGGARLTNEDAYAWAKLAKGVIGTDNVDAQLGDGLPAEVVLGLPRATIDQACNARAVVLLSGDIREELPVLFLRLRTAISNGGPRLLELTPRPTSMTPYSEVSLMYRPGELPALARRITSPDQEATTSDAADARRLLLGGQGSGDGQSQPGDGVVVILGRPSVAEGGELVAQAAATIAQALPGARFLPGLRRGNVMGALDMGLAPGVLPGRVSLDDAREWYSRAWPTLPKSRGLGTQGILEGLGAGSIKAVVLLGADPIRDFPDSTLARQGLEGAELIVAVDSFMSPSTALADVVLPVSTFHERSGTTTNIEGRVLRVAQKVVAPGLCRADWMVAAELASRLGSDLGVDDPAQLWDEVERLAPSHAGITRASFGLPSARDGLLAPLPKAAVSLRRGPAPRPLDPMGTPGILAIEEQGAPLRSVAAAIVEPDGNGHAGSPASSAPRVPPLLRWPISVEQTQVPAPDSYSLRLVAPRRLYDDGVILGACESLRPFISEGVLEVNLHDLERIGVASGGQVRVKSARSALVVETLASAELPRGTAVLTFNAPVGESAGAAALIDSSKPVTDVRLETV